MMSAEPAAEFHQEDLIFISHINDEQTITADLLGTALTSASVYRGVRLGTR